MEKQTKLILAALGLGALAYWYYNKKKTTTPATATTTPETSVPVVDKPAGYPAGVKEGDYIRLGSDATIYLLKGGKKLPITYDWMVKYAGDKWGSVIEINAADGQTIPDGETLVV